MWTHMWPQCRQRARGAIIPFLPALMSSQLKSVWLLHTDTALKRNTKQREGVQESASKIMCSHEGTAFLRPGQQKANPGATCSLLKGRLRWAKQVASHQHTARHKARAKTCNTKNPKQMQGKTFTNKNVQAGGWNHPLWKFSKHKWPWPTCSNYEACSAYSRGQGQVVLTTLNS